jgi:hypothetical protein
MLLPVVAHKAHCRREQRLKPCSSPLWPTVGGFRRRLGQGEGGIAERVKMHDHIHVQVPVQLRVRACMLQRALDVDDAKMP